MRVVAFGILVCLGADVGYHASHGPAVEAFARAPNADVWAGVDHDGRHEMTHHPEHCFCGATAADVAARDVLAVPAVSGPLVESTGSGSPLNMPTPLDHPPQLAD